MAVARSLVHVPAFVVGQLSISGVKMLSFPGLVVTCLSPLRRLAGGVDRLVAWLFLLVFRLWLYVLQFVFQFVICLVSSV